MGKKDLQPIETYMDPLKFYNHGDNPALKNFMKIAMENTRDGRMIDHRTLMLDKGQKYLLARNWDDFLQRDLQATTFPRALGIFVMNSMFAYTAFRWTRLLLPIGKFGIRKVSQTSFYHNFGPAGVAGATLLLTGALFTEYKTLKFTLHKFYRHVIVGERDWMMQQKTWTSQYANYSYSDNLLSDDDAWSKSDAKQHIIGKESEWTPTYDGAYGETQ